MSPFSEQMTNRKKFANILHILRDARINFQRLTLLLIERLLSGPLTCVDVQRLTKGSNISTMTTAQINFGFDFSQTAQEKNCITAFVHTHRHTHLRVLGWVIWRWRICASYGYKASRGLHFPSQIIFDLAPRIFGQLNVDGPTKHLFTCSWVALSTRQIHWHMVIRNWFLPAKTIAIRTGVSIVSLDWPGPRCGNFSVPSDKFCVTTQWWQQKKSGANDGSPTSLLGVYAHVSNIFDCLFWALSEPKFGIQTEPGKPMAEVSKGKKIKRQTKNVKNHMRCDVVTNVDVMWWRVFMWCRPQKKKPPTSPLNVAHTTKSDTVNVAPATKSDIATSPNLCLLR